MEISLSHHRLSLSLMLFFFFKIFLFLVRNMSIIIFAWDDRIARSSCPLCSSGSNTLFKFNDRLSCYSSRPPFQPYINLFLSVKKKDVRVLRKKERKKESFEVRYTVQCVSARQRKYSPIFVLFFITFLSFF